MKKLKTNNTKFIFITGGVISSLGKGITAASIGQILKNRGLKIFIQKFDPYINIDPGTMSPYQHGEVFVTNDGSETDLDLGHYERFLDENLSKESSITTGKIYKEVINKERKGEYLGNTVQVIPHITDEIKKRLFRAAEFSKADILIVEVGGTVGDIESLPFLEAIRQMRYDCGYHNVLYIHNTLIPYLPSIKEIKTKPTQHSIKELRSLGIQAQILVLRSHSTISENIKKKISSLCDVKKEAIFENLDVNILYQMIINLSNQGIDNFILKHFKIEKKIFSLDLSCWQKLISRIQNLKKNINIGLVGKYVQLQDAYLSIVEALKHAGYFYDVNINIQWINSENINDKNIKIILEKCDGILVPGGFGSRATNGKLIAIKYARENNIPFFGICLGMQLAVIEYARNVLNLKNADSTEINEKTSEPVIKPKIDSLNLGGTLRLGLYQCNLKLNSKIFNIYQNEIIYERHRHRYEMNSKYIRLFEKNENFIISGFYNKENLPEIIELKNHIWFIGVQFHPEFLSRPLRPHPLFKNFIQTIVKIKAF
ncbi:CTP synthase [Candidatus Phytoplasma mali]|uniref:CTP synthase n=1 Tax=Phytoplasma mali (strain AT) TaxID=482235 RepID=B3R072_PHYMT|nr:CTP synthase [Candidatus Phytoplasma mali]CAP18236.1 CTP synthase [Candidatus Phytoplasma mali]